MIHNGNNTYILTANGSKLISVIWIFIFGDTQKWDLCIRLLQILGKKNCWLFSREKVVQIQSDVKLISMDMNEILNNSFSFIENLLYFFLRLFQSLQTFYLNCALSTIYTVHPVRKQTRLCWPSDYGNKWFHLLVNSFGWKKLQVIGQLTVQES